MIANPSNIARATSAPICPSVCGQPHRGVPITTLFLALSLASYPDSVTIGPSRRFSHIGSQVHLSPPGERPPILNRTSMKVKPSA